MTRNAQNPRVRKPTALLGALIGAVALLGLFAPASALAAPTLGLSSTHVPPSVPAGTHAKYTVAVSNTSVADPTSGEIEVDFSVPAGLRVVSAADENEALFAGFGLAPPWTCTIAGNALSVNCVGPEDTFFFFGGGPLPVGPGSEACTDTYLVTCRIIVTVQADSSAPPGSLTPTITACGGAATSCPTVGATAPDDPLDIVPFEFRVIELRRGGAR